MENLNSKLLFHTVSLVAIFLSFLAIPNVSSADTARDTSPTYASASMPQATIREIKVIVRDIFDDADLSSFYQTVNGLKVSTREEVVRRELLVKSGQAYDPFLIQESERQLRTLSFLREVAITPVFDGDVVDLIVSVQDTWTIIPEASFASGSGRDRKSVGLRETDLLGFGKRVEVLYADDEGRQKVEGIYDDNRFLGSYQRLLTGYFDRSDGYRHIVYYGDPIRNLSQDESWAITEDNSDLVGRLFDAGDERFIYRKRREDYSTGYTWAYGDPEERRDRMTVGYDYTREDFTQADEDDFRDVDVDPNSVSRDPTLLAPDRKFSGPFVAFSQIHQDYLPLNYVDRFERVEDFNLGNQFDIKIGYAPEAFDSLRNTGLFFVNEARGFRFSPTSFLRAEVNGQTRLNSSSFDNTLAHLGLKYYNVMGPKYWGDTFLGQHTLAFSFQLDHAEDMDKDTEFVLGAGNGLRAYEDRAFTGTKRLVMNMEDRVHLVDDVLKLVSVGGAAFVDMGTSGNKALGDLVDDNLYGDFGVGIRLGFPRSSGGGIVRIDLAFPWREGPDGSGQLEPRLLITVGQLFSDRLRTSSFEPKPQEVEVGLEAN